MFLNGNDCLILNGLHFSLTQSDNAYISSISLSKPGLSARNLQVFMKLAENLRDSVDLHSINGTIFLLYFCSNSNTQFDFTSANDST